MDTPLNNFDKLCNSIREKATRDIEQNLPDNRLIKWQKLITAIHETELAINRVRTSLSLLKTIPSQETLNSYSISEGVWIDYQFGTWAFWMCSLIEKGIELVSQVGQKLIKPYNPQYKEVVKPLIELLVDRKNAVGKIRHPLAHKGEGGVIERVMEEDSSWKQYIIIPSPMDFNTLLAPYVPYHVRWYNFLNGYSVKVLAELYGISKHLNKHINWDKI